MTIYRAISKLDSFAGTKEAKALLQTLSQKLPTPALAA